MRRIKLQNTSSLYACVDDDDFQLLKRYKWHLDGGYASFTAHVPGTGEKVVKSVNMHRLIMMVVSPREVVDHIDGNPLNNTRANLRVVTQQQNTWNSRIRRDNTSGYKGVSKHTDGKWCAYVAADRHRLNLGLYTDLEEAAWMRDQFALALHGEYAKTNFEYV